MKKVFSIFALLMMTTLPMVAENSNINSASTINSNATYPSFSKWEIIEFYGRIGNDNDCYLHYEEYDGMYTFLNFRRYIQFGSYNRSTGRLILKAYDSNGKYIGKFVGTLTGNSCRQYKGTFTNTKGSKVTFSLYESCGD